VPGFYRILVYIKNAFATVLMSIIISGGQVSITSLWHMGFILFYCAHFKWRTFVYFGLDFVFFNQEPSFKKYDSVF